MKLLTIAISAILIMSCGQKNDSQQEVESLKNEIAFLKSTYEIAGSRFEEINDSLLNRIEELELAESLALEISNQNEENELFGWYEGDHLLTLQWIENAPPGKINFLLAMEGQFDVQGKQENAIGDFVTVDGVVYLNGKQELNFDGKIVTQVSHINNGNPCVKEGQFVFKATGKRKYWRLQEMDNCEAGGVVDYVDIYWKEE